MKRRTVVLASYPVTWYNVKTQRWHTRGALRVIRNGYFRIVVLDRKQSVSLPAGILLLLLKEMKKAGASVQPRKQQRDKLVMDFKKGIDGYKDLGISKFYKDHYSDEYLLWKERKKLLSPAERKSLEYRRKMGYRGFKNDAKVL